MNDNQNWKLILESGNYLSEFTPFIMRCLYALTYEKLVMEAGIDSATDL